MELRPLNHISQAWNLSTGEAVENVESLGGTGGAILPFIVWLIGFE